MQKLYFSFVGGCKGYQVQAVETVGQLIHEVSAEEWKIQIFQSHHPKWVIVKKAIWVENHWLKGWENELYMVKKNSFDCDPQVAVSIYGEDLYDRLYN